MVCNMIMISQPYMILVLKKRIAFHFKLSSSICNNLCACVLPVNPECSWHLSQMEHVT